MITLGQQQTYASGLQAMLDGEDVMGVVVSPPVGNLLHSWQQIYACRHSTTQHSLLSVRVFVLCVFPTALQSAADFFFAAGAQQHLQQTCTSRDFVTGW